MKIQLWRVCFIVAALLMMAGGPQHPGGTMAEMLADPKWIPAHLLILAGIVTFLVGLLLYRQSTALPRATQRWLRFAIIGTVLQIIEMAMHTAAVLDHHHLVAGQATPVLSTHLWLAVFFYPIFGLTITGFIIAGFRDHVIGSPWIGWLGIAGVLANGAAPPLVILLEIEGARILFTLILLFAVWLILAGLWPSSATGNKAVADTAIPSKARGSVR